MPIGTVPWYVNGFGVFVSKKSGISDLIPYLINPPMASMCVDSSWFSPNRSAPELSSACNLKTFRRTCRFLSRVNFPPTPPNRRELQARNRSPITATPRPPYIRRLPLSPSGGQAMLSISYFWILYIFLRIGGGGLGVRPPELWVGMFFLILFALSVPNCLFFRCKSFGALAHP